ncbi:MAG: hypothetical protein WBG50_17705 [Desulfomonilaceae bacterium]
MLRLLKSPIREWNSSILEQPLLEIPLVAQARLQSSLGVTGEIDQPFERTHITLLSVQRSITVALTGLLLAPKEK